MKGKGGQAMKKIGIDAGGSLTKIAYYDQGKLHVKTYPNEQMKALIEWLQIISPHAKLLLTGGKSGYLKHHVKQETSLIDEFQALVKGTRFLLQEEKGSFHHEFILVSMETGTSIFHVTSDGFERMLGTGIGGGTLMGLGKLISGKNNFLELIELARVGDQQQSDLLVRDIYAPHDPPLLGDLTAANFGKAHFNQDAKASDYMASLIQLIGETTLLLAHQAASLKQVGKIVFIGSTFNGNSSLKNTLESFEDMMLYESIFLNRGSYAGAIGALMIRDN